nr:phage replisome organizer N-terminal domain-containing protein [Anaerophilus nitritogenes]
MTTTMFEDEKIDFIESLPEADAILVIWVKLLTQAGKCNTNGFIFLTENIPYTEEMLAHKFRRSLNTVRLALSTFKNLGMIEMEDGYLKIANWEKHQNVEGLDKIREQTRNRVAKHREKQKLLPSNVTCNVTVTEGNATDKELDKELDKDKNIATKVACSSKLQPVMEAWNKLNLSKLISIKGNREKMLRARIKDYSLEKVILAIENIEGSAFLKGQNDRGWIITFDWLIKPNNFVKVLEGNYKDKEIKNNANSNKSKQQSKNNGFHNFESRTGKYTKEELEEKLKQKISIGG